MPESEKPMPFTAEEERELRGHLARVMCVSEWRIWGTLDRERARADAAEKARDKAIGIGPGMNDGPWEDCTDCGRRMVWQYVGPAPAWTCPNCVLIRLRDAETERDALREQRRVDGAIIAGLRAECEAWRAALVEMRKRTRGHRNPHLKGSSESWREFQVIHNACCPACSMLYPVKDCEETAWRPAPKEADRG